MRSLKELKADPQWMALHRRVKAEKQAKNQRARARLSAYRARQKPGKRVNPEGFDADALEWSQVVDDLVKQGMTRQQATIAANKKYPGLRESVVARANGRPAIKALYVETGVEPNAVELFGEIDENAAFEFKRRLARCDKAKPLVVRIDTPGGSVPAATSIYDAILAWPGNTIAMIESNAYSAGSFIAMACRERHMTTNGLMMLHAPYYEEGAMAIASDVEVLGKMADTLARAYGRHCRGGMSKVQQLMNRPEGDAWLSAEEALSLGLITKIV